MADIGKQLSFLLLFTILLVIFSSYAKIVIAYLDSFRYFIEIQLTGLFNPTTFGNLMRNSLALLAVPLLIIIVPAVFYWALERKTLPYMYHVVWIVWLILITNIST